MIEQPKKLPGWVWDAYIRDLQERLTSRQAGPLGTLLSSGPVMPRRSRRDVADTANSAVARILNDDDCACVWKAIQRRADKEDRFGIKTETWKQVAGLLEVVREAAVGPTSYEAATETERERGRRIAVMAEGLARELKLLREADPDLTFPEEIWSEIQIYEWGAVRRRKRQGKVVPDRVSVDAQWYLQGQRATLELLPEALLAIGRGAKNWGEGTPLVRRKEGSSNPYRLHFIRRISTYFRMVYGMPLHESTAALARAVYDDETSASLVAKLT